MIRYFPCELCDGTRKRGPAFLPWQNIARCNIRCLGLLRRCRVGGRTFSLLRIFRSRRVLLFSPDENRPTKAFDVGAATWVTFFGAERQLGDCCSREAGTACRAPATVAATAKSRRG